jgi:hypothetical protein
MVFTIFQKGQTQKIFILKILFCKNINFFQNVNI